MSEKVLIIGSGPAGYTAAIYAARAGLSPILFTGVQPGGQLTITTEVENYPGFKEIEGTLLMDNMREQAIYCGTRIQYETITSVDFSKFPFICNTDKNTYKSQSVIICTGASAKWLGIPGEKEYMGGGISACAVCDGPFFKNKNVAVIGGGNTAITEALHLAKLAKNVTIIHRRDSFRAERTLQDRLNQDNITIMWNTITESFFGDSMRLQGIKTNNGDIMVDGAFVAIGHSPQTSVFAGQIEIDNYGYIINKNTPVSTSINGVFAAGDVHDAQYRQAVTAAGFGCMAALEAEKWLSSL